MTNTENAVGRLPAGGNALTRENASHTKIPCRRCLIEGLDAAEVMAKLQEYIDAIEPDMRTPDDLYHRRLAVCETCPQLSGGMCRQCGCFVLYRAAKAAACCPDLTDRWNRNM